MDNKMFKKVKDFVMGIEEEIKLSETEVKLAQKTLDNDVVIEAESFEAKQPVVIVNEDGNIPLPVGEYPMGDEVLVVLEEGVIAEIKPMETEEEVPEEEVPEEVVAEEETPVEFVTVEVFEAKMAEFEAMITGLKSENEEKLTKLSEEKVELQEQLDDKPDAEIITHAPVELKAIPAKNAKERILQTIRNTKTN